MDKRGDDVTEALPRALIPLVLPQVDLVIQDDPDLSVFVPDGRRTCSRGPLKPKSFDAPRILGWLHRDVVLNTQGL